MDDKKPLVQIDPALCVRCGSCVAAYRDFFEFDDNADVRVKKDAKIDESQVDEIISVCPSGAISRA